VVTCGTNVSRVTIGVTVGIGDVHRLCVCVYMFVYVCTHIYTHEGTTYARTTHVYTGVHL